MVSVIVPIYNAEKYLSSCIESIINQSYKNLEIILINDGSTDLSGDICEEYRLKDSRIKVINQNNKGVVTARYVGVNASSGEWGFFVDADDIIPNDSIQALINHSEGFDLVSGVPKIIFPEKNLTTTFPEHIKEEGEFSGEVFIKSLLIGSRLVSVWRQLINMNILKKAIQGIPHNINISEDLILNLKIGLDLNKIKGIPDHVYNYYFHSTNMTNTIHVTLPYIDFLDSTMVFILKDKKQYLPYLFDYRINIIGQHITDKNITSAQIVKKVLKDNSYEKKLRYKLLLYLCKINSTFLRTLIWKSFIGFATSFFYLKKYVIKHG